MSHPVDTTVDLNQFEWFDSSAPLHLHSVREGGVVKFFFVFASASARQSRARCCAREARECVVKFFLGFFYNINSR